MLSNGNQTLETLGTSVISAGTGVTLVTPDHTTQIISVVIQILTVVMLWLKSKKGNSAE